MLLKTLLRTRRHGAAIRLAEELGTTQNRVHQWCMRGATVDGAGTLRSGSAQQRVLNASTPVKLTPVEAATARHLVRVKRCL